MIRYYTCIAGDIPFEKRIKSIQSCHVYLQKDHFRYPIEIQFVTSADKQFNAWLHDNTYKYLENAEVGKKLRKLYDEHHIRTEADFRKELENVLSSC